MRPRVELWKPCAAATLFILAMLYNEYRKRRPLTEGYAPPSPQTNDTSNDIATMMNNLAAATGKLGDGKSYELWVGYAYQNPDKSAKALDDFKARTMTPNCMFRRDWFKTLPAGMGRPMAAQNKDLANTAYKTYLDCLSNNSEICINQLDDFRKRFMEPGCNFRAPSDSSLYAKDYRPVFS